MLKELYNGIIKKYGMNLNENIALAPYIINYITSFMNSHKRVAIYCNGRHTQMLMTDYVFQLKGIVAIIDNYQDEDQSNGFKIISDKEIDKENIDGIIISSFVYRNEIKNNIFIEHPNVEVLDIYEEFKKDGIELSGNYYSVGYPYYNYQKINDYNLRYKVADSKEDKKNVLYELVCSYMEIKDFRMASQTARNLYDMTGDEEYKEISSDINNLYNAELESFSSINNDCLILMCIDGLRAEDVSLQKMPRLFNVLNSKSLYFENAYSYSTSTYESLIPVYSEKTDYNGKYYASNIIDEDDCRFIRRGLEQGRNIYFYTDAAKYIDSEDICYCGKNLTITERMWEFILDAEKEENGLFYIHHLYESHYSFPSPYCTEKIVADGTAMLFDYLPKRGGKLRTDYIKQQTETLHYIDDTLTPFIERIKCRMVLYADHGNLLLEKNQHVDSINPQYLTCHEDWLRIPFAIISEDNKIGRDDRLFSLLNINDVIITLLENKKYEYAEQKYLKCGRSDIYNPDFHYLYNKLGEGKRLQAFECFIFKEYKLVIYKDATKELYSLKDELIQNQDLINHCLEIIKKDITICSF